MDLAQKLEEVQSVIAYAADISGRSAKDVTLIAVTKTHPSEVIDQISALGVHDIGENRAQEVCAKFPDIINDDVRVHLIGHLQTNKVKTIIDKAHMIHSVDSFHLAKEISHRAGLIGKVQQVLLQVNVAGEEQKFGVSPEGLFELIEQVAPLDNLRVMGLMTIAPFVVEPQENRVHFAAMRALFEKVSGQDYPHITMQHLSMGMSGDYAVAIEEGATMVRIGRTLFGERNYH